MSKKGFSPVYFAIQWLVFGLRAVNDRFAQYGPCCRTEKALCCFQFMTECSENLSVVQFLFAYVCENFLITVHGYEFSHPCGKIFATLFMGAKFSHHVSCFPVLCL